MNPEPSLERLTALASAVAGHLMVVEWGRDGKPATTDGRRIRLNPNEAQSARTAVVIQAALVAAGSLEPDVLVKLRRSRRVRTRYLVLEIGRAMAMM